MTDSKDEDIGAEDLDSLWDTAFEEQGVDINAQKEESAPATPADVFKPLKGDQVSISSRELDMIRDIPVNLTVQLGSARLTIQKLLELSQGSVIELKEMVGEPMDIYINNYLLASGEVVAMEEKYGIRITEIITPSERIKKLNS